MKKYLIYRTLGKIQRDIKKHELIGIEYGADIFSATDKIIKAIQADSSELPEYAGYDEADVYPPEKIDHLKSKTRYTYYSDAVLASPNLPEAAIIPYGIVEKDTNNEYGGKD